MKRCYRFIFLLSIFLLSSQSTLSQVLSSQAAPPPLKREFRGAWIATVTNLDWPSSRSLTPQQQRDELVFLLDQLCAAGINAVIFQVRPECDALYNSPYEPWSYWLTGEQGKAPNPLYDPLEFALEEAHIRGMELHAWFNPYRAVRPSVYTRASSHVSNTHPEWILDFPTGKILDPGLPAVRDHVAKVVADIVRRYDVDGVHADDYFYPYPDGAFTGITNEDDSTFVHYSRGFTNRGDWRRDNVNLLIKQIYDSVQVIKPRVKFGMSPFGIYRPNTPPGITGLDAYSTIYCDALAWLNGRYIDYVVPQLYWQIGGGQDYSKLMPWWASQANGRHMYSGNAIYRVGTSFGDASEIANQVNLNRGNSGVQGSIFFRANNIRDNIGGLTDLLKADIFRSPSVIPVMNWKEQTPPNSPQNLRADFNALTSIYTLRWDPPTAASDGDTASRYIVYRFTSSSYQPSDLENWRYLIALTGQPSTVPPARIDTVGVRYYYAVASLDRNNNESSLSNIVPISAAAGVPALASPVNGEPNFSQGGALRWNRVPLAQRYKVEVASGSDFAAVSLVTTGNVGDASFVPGGLVAQSTYYWRVVAGTQGEAGQFSAARSFTTGWPLPPTPLAPVTVVNAPLRPTFVWTKSGGTSFRVRVATASWATGPTVLDTTVTDTTFVSSRDLQPGPIYIWRVSASNPYGSSDWSVEGRFRTQQPTLVLEPGSLPTEYSLSQNYPNPFNPSTTIEFGIPVSGNVRVVVYNLLGQEVSVLIDEFVSAGRYKVIFNGRDLASGMYFSTLTAGDKVLRNKMLLLK